MATLPQNAQTIYGYLRDVGLSPNAAAGIVGNIGQESGGNPAAGVWPANYGLIQWTPASNYFSSPPSLEQQLPAIVSYIQANGSIADVNAHAASPQAAALYFSQRYERPAASAANNPNREAVAQLVAQTFGAGGHPSGAVASSGQSGAATSQGTGTHPAVGQAGQTGAAGASSGTAADVLTADDYARLGYMGLLGQYGPGIFDPTSQIGTTLTAAQDAGYTLDASFWSKLWNDLNQGLKNATGGPAAGGKAIQGAVGGAKAVVGGAETAAGVLVNLTKPVNLLRALEVAAGAALLGIGLAMYVSILIPGLGGIVGMVAGAAAPEVALAGAASRAAGRASTRASTATAASAGRSMVSPTRTVDRGANRARVAAVREQELTARETRAAASQMRAERGFHRAMQPQPARSRPAGSSPPRTNRPPRVTRQGGRDVNEYGEEMFT